MSKVYLVGAGPGDPELITVKGRRVLARAQCVLYDHLSPESLLECVPPDAERIYVGKKRTEHALSQEEISALIVERARRGLTVIRLKGGDPFIFGRGGEELEALADAGIPFEVVPGVTSALGIGAYAGVPLTHRDHTSSVTFVTGHTASRIDWGKVGSADTIVIYMGLTELPAIAAALMGTGRAPSTPALAVRWGTRPDQQSVAGTLETLPRLASEAGMKPPATVIIGDVVRLRDGFNWFERLPLFGRRIAITRDRSQAQELAAPLRELGAAVIEYPTIEIRGPADPGPLDAAIARLEVYDWLLFTSVNGVDYFMRRLDRSDRDLRSIRARLCTIGPATRAAVEVLHLKVDLTPPEYVAESLVEAFQQFELAGRRVLLPRAAVARDVVPVELTKRGAIVDVVEAYRTVVPKAAPFPRGEVDWITFTSSSTVKNFLALAGREALENVRIASIGPVTSATLRMHGLDVQAEAKPYTMAGLVAAIVSECRPAQG